MRVALSPKPRLKTDANLYVALVVITRETQHRKAKRSLKMISEVRIALLRRRMATEVSATRRRPNNESGER